MFIILISGLKVFLISAKLISLKKNFEKINSKGTTGKLLMSYKSYANM